MNKRMLYVACLTGLVFLAGCSTSPKEKEKKVVNVSTIVAGSSTHNGHLNYVGIVEEETGVNLSFRVQGTVQQVFVSEGQSVRRGSLLALLDDEKLKQAYNGAKASYDQAQDAMQRMQLLYDNESLPEIKYIEVKTKLEQAKSMYFIAKQNLEDTRLFASMDGVIGRKYIEIGENVMPGQTVFTLVDISFVKVKIAVPEREMPRLFANQNALLQFPVLGEEVYSGNIFEKGVLADPMSHTYEASLRLANPSGHILPGMLCNVAIETASTEAPSLMVLPNNAIQISEKDERFVWCVKADRAVAVKVELGELTHDGVVIKKGLTEGDVVIVGGMHKVGEGTRVKSL